jgi:hypothetical protein
VWVDGGVGGGGVDELMDGCGAWAGRWVGVSWCVGVWVYGSPPSLSLSLCTHVSALMMCVCCRHLYVWYLWWWVYIFVCMHPHGPPPPKKTQQQYYTLELGQQEPTPNHPPPLPPLKTKIIYNMYIIYNKNK